MRSLESADLRLLRRPLVWVTLAGLTAALVTVLLLQAGGDSPEARADVLAAPANADYFLKIENVDGEATDEGHRDWINLRSFSHGITRPATGAGTLSGSIRSRGVSILEDLVLVKEIDKSTPKLAEAVITGRVYPTAQLHVTGGTADQRTTYYIVELKNVQVSNYRISAGGDSVPMESFSLNFGEIRVTYDETDSTGKSQGKVEYTWKVEEGVK